MRKLLAAAIVSISALVASFTPASAQGRWGIVGGVDLTTLHFNQDLFTVDQSVGFVLGGVGDMALGTNGFGMSTGLIYTQRGATLHLGERAIWGDNYVNGNYGNERSYLHYIDIPVYFRYTYLKMDGFENTLAPMVFFGPSFSFLAANNKVTALDYARMSISLQFGIGAQIKRNYQVTALYDLGVTYAEKTKILLDDSARNRGWQLRFTYFFE